MAPINYSKQMLAQSVALFKSYCNGSPMFDIMVWLFVITIPTKSHSHKPICLLWSFICDALSTHRIDTSTHKIFSITVAITWSDILTLIVVCSDISSCIDWLCVTQNCPTMSYNPLCSSLKPPLCSSPATRFTGFLNCSHTARCVGWVCMACVSTVTCYYPM